MCSTCLPENQIVVLKTMTQQNITENQYLFYFKSIRFSSFSKLIQT